MINLYVYTDGACSGNPGKGGAAWLIAKHDTSSDNQPGILKTGSSGYRKTTNNRMELCAAIAGIHNAVNFITGIQANLPDAMVEDYTITVRTDSALVVGLMNEGWKPKANLDLVDELITRVNLAGRHRITFEKVKGHTGDTLNEEADRLAVEARDLPANMQLVDPGYEVTGSTNQPKTNAGDLFDNLRDEYETESDVCAAEFLAGKTVPEGVTFEEAFQAYIAMMKTIEGDRFVQIREKEIVEL